MIADPAWKSALLHKGKDVADLLEAVLSGKDVDLASLPVPSGRARIRSCATKLPRPDRSRHQDLRHRRVWPLPTLRRRSRSRRVQQQPWLATCPVHAGGGSRDAAALKAKVEDSFSRFRA